MKMILKTALLSFIVTALASCAHHSCSKCCTKDPSQCKMHKEESEQCKMKGHHGMEEKKETEGEVKVAPATK
jgi:hypothetical protein